jgi:hypothetical protein
MNDIPNDITKKIEPIMARNLYAKNFVSPHAVGGKPPQPSCNEQSQDEVEHSRGGFGENSNRILLRIWAQFFKAAFLKKEINRSVPPLYKTTCLNQWCHRQASFVLSVFAPAVGAAIYLNCFSYPIMETFYRPELIFEFGILLYFAFIISAFQRSKLMGALLTSVALRGAPLQSTSMVRYKC